MKKYKYFDIKNAASEELWEYGLLEYQSNNPITKSLINNYYKCMKKIISNYSKQDDRILEVGCGAGESSMKIASMLSGQYFEVSEYDERYLVNLRKYRPELRASKENVYEINRDENEFDIVFLLEVLEHLDDYNKALSELFRVAKKYVVISVPNEPMWKILNFLRGKYWKDLGNTPGHINHWSKHKILNLLGEYGDITKV